MAAMLSLIVRVDTEDTRSAEMLKQDGWRESDEIVTYIRDCFEGPTNSIVRKAIPTDLPEVVAAANICFAPKDKTKWVTEAFARKDRQILVAEPNGGIAGFIIVRYEKDAAVIDLIGCVARRKGYATLMVESIAHLRHGKPYIQAGTQTKNEVAREFYRHLGFIVKHRRRTFLKP